MPSTTATVRVKPSTRLGRATPDLIRLNVMDLIMPAVYVRLHFFFQPDPTRTWLETTQHLQSSLADALEHYPPISGTITPNSDGHLSISCDGRGADFIYDTRDYPHADLPNGDADDLAPRGPLVSDAKQNSALLAVKATMVSLPPSFSATISSNMPAVLVWHPSLGTFCAPLCVRSPWISRFHTHLGPPCARRTGPAFFSPTDLGTHATDVLLRHPRVCAHILSRHHHPALRAIDIPASVPSHRAGPAAGAYYAPRGPQICVCT